MTSMKLRSTSSSLSYFFTLCVLSGLLFFLDTQKILGPFHQGFDTVVNPVKKILYSIKQTTYNSFVFISFARNGSRKLIYLEQRVAELTVDSERLTALERENTALRDQMGVTGPNTYSLLPANVIGLDRYLLLDKGELSGVKKGMAVLSKNIYIGTIFDTKPTSSRVLLPTDPDSLLSVQTSKNGVKGILVGQFGSAMQLTKVVQQDELKVNDTIITSGEGSIPKGFIIGTIGSITKKENELFQSADIKSLVDINRIEIVFINK
jgi:rod shape-determining protein MreC